MFGVTACEQMAEVLVEVCPAVKSSPPSVMAMFWREVHGTGIEVDQVIAWASGEALRRRPGQKYLALDDIVRWCRTHGRPRPAPGARASGPVGDRPDCLTRIEGAWAAEESVREGVASAMRRAFPGNDRAREWSETAHRFVRDPVGVRRDQPWFFGPVELDGRRFGSVLESAEFRAWVRERRAIEGLPSELNADLAVGPGVESAAAAVPADERLPAAVSLGEELASLHEGFGRTGAFGPMAAVLAAARISSVELDAIVSAARARFACVVPASAANPFAGSLPPRERFVWRWDRSRAAAYLTHAIVDLAWRRGVDVGAVFAKSPGSGKLEAC